MRLTVHPSQAILVPADTSIRECIDIMKTRRARALIVISDNQEKAILGIFTVWDLVEKFDLIQTGTHWNKPVRTVMTKSVKTLPVSEIHHAGRLMLKHGFRTIPITSGKSAQKSSDIVGLVSTWDLFKILVEKYEKDIESKRLPMMMPSVWRIRVGVFSKNPLFRKYLKESLSYYSEVEVERLSLPKVLPPTGHVAPLYRFNLIFVDIDHFKPSDWLKVLELSATDVNIPYTVILFDPALHNTATFRFLKKLGATEDFSVYAKPLNMFQIIEELTEHFARE